MHQPHQNPIQHCCCRYKGPLRNFPVVNRIAVMPKPTAAMLPDDYAVIFTVARQDRED